MRLLTGVLIMMFLIVGCRQSQKENANKNSAKAETKASESIIVYKWNGEIAHISAMALINKKVYYFRSLPNTDLNKGSLLKAKAVNDIGLNELLHNMAATKFSAADIERCRCKAISKSSFIIEWASDFAKRVFVNQVIQCSSNTPCIYMDGLYHYFSKYEKLSNR